MSREAFTMDGVSWHSNEKNLRLAYFVLVAVRLLWTLLPQSGYVYPDEFFQSPEVMARDFFSFSTTITWEWNETFPVRSPVSAFLSSGIPYAVLNSLYNIELFKTTSYLLLVFPRIYMASISLLSFDIPVYILCRRLNLDPFIHLFVLSTSYVTQVFGTRPFSNVLETGLFGLLLVLLLPGGYKDVSGKNDKSAHKGQDPTNVQCVLAGSLTSLGFFCRLTFLAFAITPYVGYFSWKLKSQRTLASISHMITRVLLMAFGFLIASMLIVLVDSWYFGYLQNGNIVLTPWNSIKYNTMQAHTHGHHPFFTHLLINMPLLFGPIAFLYYFKLLSISIRRSSPPDDHLMTGNVDDPQMQDYKYYCHLVLLSSIFVPVVLLSFIPHQEPRFIMPVLLPLILSMSQKIVKSKHSQTFLLSWCIWNAIGGLFFGVLHQGGVVPSLLHLDNVIKDKTKTSSTFCHHLVYFHTYMPPRHLLPWPNRIPINGHWLYIHDLAGSSEEVFYQTKSKIRKEYCHGSQQMLYVLCPGTIKIGIENQKSGVSFFPHLTMEDPPNLNFYLTELIFGTPPSSDNIPGEDNYGQGNVLSNVSVRKLKLYFRNFIYQVQRIKSELSLNLYVLKI